ncbi:Ankyrin-3 [Tolypocladium ophioglossoides CBS 100239]|uniref:Ankyrin-3 n=1 Tax=Tolypocladium ophioglossoides (strain CBS 100239) TaxID=1163406 RepID=A0A0L0NI59_TOLOC|nr:Ankyrin-3 [Tolypocladium ophioglossoides CBS 100239]
MDSDDEALRFPRESMPRYTAAWDGNHRHATPPRLWGRLHGGILGWRHDVACSSSWWLRGVVQLLVDAGANVSATNFDAETPLYVAAHFAHESAAKVLLGAGANAEARTYCGENLLWRNTTRMNIGSGCEHHLGDGEGGISPSRYCAMQWHVSVIVPSGEVERCLDGPVERRRGGDTALQRAARISVELVDLILAAGGDLADMIDGGTTLLHIAGGPRVVERLIDAGADVEAKTHDGETPLHFAADKGS